MERYAKFQHAEWEQLECGMPMESPQYDVYGGGEMGVQLLCFIFLEIFENDFLNVKFYSKSGNW